MKNVILDDELIRFIQQIKLTVDSSSIDYILGYQDACNEVLKHLDLFKLKK